MGKVQQKVAAKKAKAEKAQKRGLMWAALLGLIWVVATYKYSPEGHQQATRAYLGAQNLVGGIFDYGLAMYHWAISLLPG